MKVNLASSKLVKTLVMMRGIPQRLARGSDLMPRDSARFTIQDMVKENFILLAEDHPNEIVLGAVGCFWKPIPMALKMENPVSYLDFQKPGYAKIGWNILIEKPDELPLRVSTETRVQCLGKKALFSFLPYWAVIRPFSGMIRIKMLQEIKRMAESEAVD